MAALTFVCAFYLTACGGDGSSSETASTPSTTSFTTAATTTPITDATNTTGATAVPCSALLFFTLLLPEVYVNRVKVAYETGCEYLSDIQPMEVWLTSNDETEAQALRNKWCTHRQGSDPGFLTRGCERSQIGVGLANYVF